MIGTVYKLLILGNPRVQKNSRAILHVGGQGFCPVCKQRKGAKAILAEDSKVKKWRKNAVQQLQAQWINKPTITDPLVAILICYLGKRQRSDADNLAAGPLDALETAKVIKNDSQISEVVILRRKDWDDPRVEIYLFDSDRLQIEILRNPAGADEQRPELPSFQQMEM
jgi:Holliday junction resolvase RusA-like endonuclease